MAMITSFCFDIIGCKAWMLCVSMPASLKKLKDGLNLVGDFLVVPQIHDLKKDFFIPYPIPLFFPTIYGEGKNKHSSQTVE